MIEPFDVVCLSTDSWAPIVRRRRHLMEALVRLGYARRILFVEPAFSCRAVASTGYQDPRYLVALARGAANVRPVLPGIGALAPCFFLPFARVKAIRDRNIALAAPLVRAAMRRMGISRPVVWLSHPRYAPYVTHLAPRLLVYDRTDPWTVLPDGPVHYTAGEEADLCRRAGVVFAVSERLLQDSLMRGAAAHLLPNAAHLESFAPCVTRRQLSAHDPVRIGYVGSIWKERLDSALVQAVALRRPRYLFEFVGPIHDAGAVAALRTLPNVRFSGPLPFEALPGFLCRCQAVWIPHRTGPLTQAMNPIKLWEYLAAGLPTVSTPVAGLEPFGDLVRVARDPAATACALDSAIQDDDLSARVRRRRAVESHSWDTRVETAARVIVARLGGYEAGSYDDETWTTARR